MVNYTVSSVSEFNNALKVAGSGDTIFLSPGEYSSINVSNFNNVGEVTITSADPDNLAIITRMTVANSEGLKFSDLELSLMLSNSFQIRNSSRLTFDNLDMHGNGVGINMHSSSEIIIQNSVFREFGGVMSLKNSEYVLVQNNQFHTIKGDGIFVGGTSHITISGNVFYDFDHTGEIHPDAIQFSADNGLNDQVTDIVITGNVFNRGVGTQAQGIFFRGFNGHEFGDVTVSDNIILGSLGRGISISNAQETNISNNIVLGYQDLVSGTFTDNVSSVSTAGNISSFYGISGAGKDRSSDVSVSVLDADTSNNLTNILYSIMESGSQNIASQFRDVVLNSIDLENSTSVQTNLPSDLYDYAVTLYASEEGGKTQGFGSADLIYGGAGKDTIYGFDGDDIIFGGAGSDILEGNNGNDIIFGGDGNDVISGGKGADILTGGAGQDFFIYRPGDLTADFAESMDIITDFNPGEKDIINLSAIDANILTEANDWFRFIGDHEFTGVAGQLRYAVNDDGIRVLGDVDGDSIADFAIQLNGLTSITANSFYL